MRSIWGEDSRAEQDRTGAPIRKGALARGFSALTSGGPTAWGAGSAQGGQCSSISKGVPGSPRCQTPCALERIWAECVPLFRTTLVIYAAPWLVSSTAPPPCQTGTPRSLQTPSFPRRDSRVPAPVVVTCTAEHHPMHGPGLGPLASAPGSPPGPYLTQRPACCDSGAGPLRTPAKKSHQLPSAQGTKPFDI